VEQSQILRHAADTLDSLAVPYMVVGSRASIAYGETRFTQDKAAVTDICGTLPASSA
jgi:hypothetical protein